MSTAGEAPIATSDDLSSLSWVHDELRKSLEAANKLLRRWLKDAEAAEASELDSIDPALLRQARGQFHQGVGVLELVGMGTAANVLRAGEAALLRLAARPRLLTAAAVDTIEHGAFALLDYLGRLLAGKPVSPLAMFPQYRALQELAAAARIHPADLWPHDWQWRTLSVDPSVPARAFDAAVVSQLESELLALMRGQSPGVAARMSALFAGLGASAGGHHATLWLLAAAFFEAQAGGHIQLDNYSKRVASRLLAQLRASDVHGDASDRLAQDLLFFCAQALYAAGNAAGPRLAAVRGAYPLDPQGPGDYESVRLGRFDPAWVAQARKRVASVKAVWSDVAGGELARLSNLAEQFALVGDSIQRLFPDGGLLSRALQAAAGQTAASASAPPPALAMEVATALLYIDASLDDADFDDPELADRIARLALRVGQVRHGRDPGPIELWMEDLYRRVSDRQTMGSVVQELRASLSEIEKNIDQYFRDPARREVLIPVPGQLSAMRGVLSVLGLDQASQAVLRMRDDVDALASTEVDPVRAVQAGTFDHLADNLGALTFLIDMVSVQPQMAKTMFRFEPATGKLAALLPRRARPTAFGEFETGPSEVADLSAPVRLLDRASPPQLEGVPSTLAGSLEEFGAENTQILPPRPRDDVPTAWDLEELTAPERDTLVQPHPTVTLPSAPMAMAEPVPSALTATPTGLEDDAEMRSVFLDEAREVITSAREALAELQLQHSDLGAMTTVRRAFHTLKGSARMVGLGDFGAAAWACEQLYNSLLAGHGGVDGQSHALTGEALDHFGRWTDALESGDASGFDPQAVIRAADAMRLEHRHVALARAAPPSLAERVPGLPSASDLDLEFAAPEPAEVPPAVGDEFDIVFADEVPTERVVPKPVAEAPTPPEPAPALPEVEEISFDLAAFDEEPVAPAAPPPVEEVEDAEQFKRIGPLQISIALFNIYLNEADELSRRLGAELAEWSLEPQPPVSDSMVALAHSLAGSSATVGYAELSMLARALEHALDRSRQQGRAGDDEARLFNQAAEEIRRLLHQFAAGFLPDADAALVRRLLELAHAPAARADEAAAGAPAVIEPEPAAAEQAAIETLAAEPAAIEPSAEERAAIEIVAEPVAEAVPPEPPPQIVVPAALTELGRPALMPFADLPSVADVPHAVHPEGLDAGADIDAVDAIDAELFPVFEEEAQELLPQLHARLRDWSQRPDDSTLGDGCMRTLHTLKGGARLAGAMRLGELAHQLETAIEHLIASPALGGVREVEALIAQADVLEAVFDALRQRQAAPPAVAPAAIDWQRFAPAAAALAPRRGSALGGAAPTVRVRAPLLDRLVNQAGEISIARARLATEVGQIGGAVRDLTENIERLRTQLREIELQADLQIGSRLEAARAAAQEFDPLEMDRFTRFQEITRVMAESVADVATVQRGLQRALQSADDDLAQQARLTRDMQDDLLRTRMVEFEGLSERLYRVVRQAAKESAKQVRLDIVGGQIEVDRGVLDRMTGTFEHLLRNAVVHGIEAPAQRQAAGKDPTGSITIAVSQVGNEVGVEVRDDGAGVDLARIRQRGLALGMLQPEDQPSDAALTALIFEPGFSTADEVTGLAGRGVGMDVVRTEVAAIGGRIETASAAGQGASFRLVLPLTTAVTQVVMLRCGEQAVAVPSTLVEIVRRMPVAELAQAYTQGSCRFGERDLPFFWLDALLQGSARGVATGRTALVLVIRSADQRVVVHVDEVLGNQEVVVKHLGPQLARLPGLVGMTLLPSGVPALIYNPVALATLYGESAREFTAAALRAAAQPRSPQAAAEAAAQAPLVVIVDDSLTVRRVTQRLLLRDGYRVAVAKDGLEGLEVLAAERPAVLLTDIEMPRMDGFDLVRNLRADPRLADLPVIMITSRIAQKHRDYAAELGVDHYLGKPYAEDELLLLLARYARRTSPA